MAKLKSVVSNCSSSWWRTLDLIWIHCQVCKIKTWAFVHNTEMQRSYEKVILKKWEGGEEAKQDLAGNREYGFLNLHCQECWGGSSGSRAGSWKRAGSMLERKRSLWLSGHFLNGSQGLVAGCSFAEVSWQLLLVLYLWATKSPEMKELL